MDTKPVKKENSKGINKFCEIKNKHEFIKYTFDEEYMEELNNIREKLLYEQEDEEASENSNLNEINNNNINNKNEKNINITNNTNINLNLETNAEERNNNLNSENQNLFNITQLPEKDINIEVKSICKITVKVNKNVIN